MITLFMKTVHGESYSCILRVWFSISLNLVKNQIIYSIREQLQLMFDNNLIDFSPKKAHAIFIYISYRGQKYPLHGFQT